MTRPLRVFLCHASQDKPAVRKLHRYLKQRGVQPWLDELDLLPGEYWEVEIPNAIFSSDVILVCLSKNSVDKEGYVQKEITFALDKAQEKPEGTIFIIPVKLEDCDVPKRMNRYQWVDLFRPDGYKRLMMGLNKRAAGLGPDISPILTMDETRPKPARVGQISNLTDKAEKDALEKAKHEADEEAAREKQEREAAELAARQKLERDEREKAAREKIEFEAIEKIRREKAEQDAAELAAREAKEKAMRETAEKIAREKRESEAREKAKREKSVGRIANPAYANLRLLGIGGIILLALILGGLGLNYLINNLPVATAATSSPTNTVTSKPPTSTSIPFTPTPQRTKTPVPLPTLGIGSTMISEKDGMTLLYVPAGKFTMGSDNGGSDEKPEHEVTLNAFWIDQTEVTNKMFAQCAAANQCDPPTDTKSYTHSSYYGNSEFDNYPVIYVDWNRANAYCKWADRRLPAEAEWEKAARGPDGNVYPWGNTFDGTLVNFCDTNCSFDWVNKSFDDGYADVSPVGNYPLGKSFYGAYDMAGNVWEWVNDWYSETYYQSSPSSNPSGPDSGIYRVLRGGSWFNNYVNVRSAYRYWVTPDFTYGYVGFRCARSQ